MMISFKATEDDSWGYLLDGAGLEASVSWARASYL